ncbi:MAG TPA: SDR family oxidoreductase [Thermoleophilaceae bacterium]|nr:SDR family oxidoreductase [Thermoleophilaceae bacterium]
MLLEDKSAVIYGGGGSIGSAVARVFAREGAKVFLAGRTPARLDEVAGEIRSAGGVAETAEVDALDAAAVDRHADEVAEKAGGIDVSFNLISHGAVQGTPMVEMSPEDYERPVVTAVMTTFLTTRAAGLGRDPGFRRLGRAVARPLSGRPPGRIRGDRIHAPPALVGARPSWVRVVTLRTGGVPESIPEGFEGSDQIAEEIERTTMLGRAATLEDIGNVAAFVASDRARTMTAATANVSCGALVD